MEHLSNYCSFIQITGAFPLSESRVSFIITESCSEETVGILEELIPEEWGGEGGPSKHTPLRAYLPPQLPRELPAFNPEPRNEAWREGVWRQEAESEREGRRKDTPREGERSGTRGVIALIEIRGADEPVDLRGTKQQTYLTNGLYAGLETH